MKIQKFQSPSGPIQKQIKVSGWTPKSEDQAAKQFIQAATDRNRQLVQKADQQLARRTQADQKANRKTKVPYAHNMTAYLQEALYNIGAYNDIRNRRGTSLTYDQAVDGNHGKMTDAAIEKAREMGYDVDVNSGTVTKRQENKFFNTSRQKSTMPTFTTSTGMVYDPDTHSINILKNVLAETIPTLSQSYLGTEEEARKLGYKTYGLAGTPVDYSVAPEDSASTRSIAEAQMKRYGITQEQAQDKSKLHRFLYEYMPTNGYSIPMMIEGIFRGDKNADSKTGRAVKSDKERPVAEKVEKAIGKVYDFFTNSTEGSEQAQRSAGYSRNASPKREDLRNLMMGYPIVNGTLEVTPFDEMGKGEFQDGYGFRFRDRAALNEARNADLSPGEHRQIKDGYDMGAHGISRSKEGDTRSYYDYWNINPLTVIPGRLGRKLDEMFPEGIVGRGFDLYDRTK